MLGTANEIMLADFAFVDCNATIAEAEEFFEAGNLTGLPVLNPDRTVFGLLTAQNLLAFHRQPGGNAKAVHAWEICNARPLVATGDTPLEDVAEAVLLTSGRHVLVVNEDRQLVGIINNDMLVRYYVLPDHTVTTIERAAANPLLNGKHRRPT